MEDSTCEECRMKVEMTGHLFWYCPSAREVWEFLKLVIPVGLNHC